MKTFTDINEAIDESVSHNEIVRVEYPSIGEAMTHVDLASVDYDHTDTGDGFEDVWGKREDGSEFRLQIYTPGHRGAPDEN